MKRTATTRVALLWGAYYLFGCTPSVKIEAPDKPIEINMNIKIEHEIRLKIEKDVDDLMSNQKGLF
ncbi:YnbE family lipoprotein [Methylosoma difficile]